MTPAALSAVRRAWAERREAELDDEQRRAVAIGLVIAAAMEGDEDG